jgi:hypothetical protein
MYVNDTKSLLSHRTYSAQERDIRNEQVAIPAPVKCWSRVRG